MSDYIDREAFYQTEKLLDTDIIRKSKTASLLIDQFFYDLKTYKKADVAPVKYAKWVWNPNGIDWGLGAWECSNCYGKNDNLPGTEKIDPFMVAGSSYCPSCGAKMIK